MQQKRSSLAGPLWVVGVGLCILGIGVGYYAWVLSQQRAIAEQQRLAIARLKATSETVTTTTTTTLPPARAALPSARNLVTNPQPIAPTQFSDKAPAESSPVTAPITAPKKADFFGLAGSQPAGGTAQRPQIFGRVTLKGTPPTEKELPLDPACGKLHPASKPTTRFYVVSPDGGLTDVLVVLSVPNGSFSWRGSFPPVVIDQVGCEYVPYVSAGLAGESIWVKNSDPLLHNVHTTPVAPNNRESNRAHPPRTPPLQFKITQEEFFLRFKCDIHPWMFAYVNIVSHPYFAVTDATGAFRLNATPPPGRYTIEAHHRKAGKLSHQIEVRAGENLKLDFEIKVPAGNQ